MHMASFYPLQALISTLIARRPDLSFFHIGQANRLSGDCPPNRPRQQDHYQNAGQCFDQLRRDLAEARSRETLQPELDRCLGPDKYCRDGDQLTLHNAASQSGYAF
jgi:hypothetical protein